NQRNAVIGRVAAVRQAQGATPVRINGIPAAGKLQNAHSSTNIHVLQAFRDISVTVGRERTDAGEQAALSRAQFRTAHRERVLPAKAGVRKLRRWRWGAAIVPPTASASRGTQRQNNRDARDRAPSAAVHRAPLCCFICARSASVTSRAAPFAR